MVANDNVHLTLSIHEVLRADRKIKTTGIFLTRHFNCCVCHIVSVLDMLLTLSPIKFTAIFYVLALIQ